MTSTKNKSLFSDFSPVSREEWEKVIESDLRGADYRKKLKWNTLEGVEPLPFYRRDDMEGLSPVDHPPYQPPVWRYTEPVFETDPSAIAERIREGQRGGATSFQLTCGPGEAPIDAGSFKQMFSTLSDNPTPILFDSGAATPALIALADGNRLFDGSLFRFDPFTVRIRTGQQVMSEKSLGRIVQELGEQEPFRALCADGFFWHMSGATIVQEIGIALAIAAEHLQLARSGAAGSLWFRLSAGPLYFPEIAKVRALRLLGRNLLEGFGARSDQPIFIHSETTLQNKTLSDPHNNMIRVTTEAMAAVLGGVDSLTLNPFDCRSAQPGDRSLRVARNVHHIVREEAGFGRVINPASGSYYIEQLTDQIAEKAWELFQRIEESGGFTAATRDGWLQKEVRRSAEQKNEAYSRRMRTLTGTNNYPDPEEIVSEPAGGEKTVSYEDLNLNTDTSLPEKLIPKLKRAFADGKETGDLFSIWMSAPKPFSEAPAPFFAGDRFDDIRLRLQRAAKQRGKPFTALTLPVGDPKWRSARATFARNLIGCAGIQTISPTGFDTLDEAVEKIESSAESADIIILCSSDREAADIAPQFAEQFRNGRILIQAGNPGEQRNAFEQAGISRFIYSGMDAAEFLESIADLLIENLIVES